VTLCTVQRNKSWLIFKSWYFIEIMLYIPYKKSFLNCLFFKKRKGFILQIQLEKVLGFFCLYVCLFFYLIILKLVDTCSWPVFCTGWVGMGHVNSIDPFPRRNWCHGRRLSVFKRSQLHIFFDFKNKFVYEVYNIWSLREYSNRF